MLFVFFFFSLSFLSLSIRKFRAREEKRAKGQERSSLSERLFFVLYIMVFYSILFVDFFYICTAFFPIKPLIRDTVSLKR